MILIAAQQRALAIKIGFVIVDYLRGKQFKAFDYKDIPDALLNQVVSDASSEAVRIVEMMLSESAK